MSKLLQHLDPDNFLSEYWQKKPLLIRQAIPDFIPPISADELAGLALEEDVESRLILEQAETPWELRNGPFTEETFSTLPESHWTLLVQAVDHWVPKVHELLEYFRFLPSWRLEDIMISYATNGGNVGPHYDQFDVFLIQAEGKRRWQIGSVYNDQAPMVKNTPLHILSEFDVLENYVLESGDMLYLPPGIGHHGVAQGECMTISVGFRAPSHRDILMQFTDFVADQLSESLRYSDPDQKQVQNSGEINQEAVDRVQRILKSYVEDRDLIAQWFGQAMTEPKYPQTAEEEIEDWTSLVSLYGNSSLSLSEGSRIAYHASKALIFTDGSSQQCMDDELLNLVKSLCDKKPLTSDKWTKCSNEESRLWLIKLINSGILFPEETSNC